MSRKDVIVPQILKKRNERWNEDWRREMGAASFLLNVPGPLSVQSETVFDEEGDIEVDIGPLRVGISWDAAEGLIYALVSSMYGELWAGAILSLCLRTPTQEYLDGYDPEETAGAIQALWKAADSFRDLSPDRHYDDELWGVTPPEGVYLYSPQTQETP